MHARNTTGVQYHVTRSVCMHVGMHAEVIVCSLPSKVEPTQCVYHGLLGCILVRTSIVIPTSSLHPYAISVNPLIAAM